MHQPLILQHLFQVSALEDVSRERLESFVESYPSYGIGHYLLSCKLQAEGSDRFLPETQRTCLYFSNPLWLQWLLQNSDASIGTQPVGSPAASVVEPVALEAYSEETVETVAPVETSYDAPAWEQAVETTVEAAPVETTDAAPTETTYSAAPVGETPVENPESAVENVVTMAEEAFGESETITTTEIDSITAGEGETLATPVTTPRGEGLSAADQLLRSIEEARELRESLQKLHAEPVDQTTMAGESLPMETKPVDEPAVETAAIAETPAAYETVAPPEEPVAVHETTVPQEEPIRDEEVPFVLEERPVMEEVVAAAEAQAAPETSKPAAAVTQDFLFEPYHTIDYFASQGIKLTLEENPSDTLGKQLKSFTDWLKTMRRLPQKDREVVPDRVAEQAVQTSAAHSILGKDVVTETMAEVLAKQGMREKARVVYEKLSLLNPDKRAYFAAKIEQLNIP